MIQTKADVMKYLPHREPFLFIDEVISLYEGDRIHARMHINDNDIFLEGHFPGNPIVPGVILIEAMGQAAGILGFKTMKKTPDEGSQAELAEPTQLSWPEITSRMVTCLKSDMIKIYAALDWPKQAGLDTLM